MVGAPARAFMCMCVRERGVQQAGVAGQVMYGMDYVEGERQEQHNRVREAVLEHLKRYPAALLVVEEYDKLDCPSRAVLRQLLSNPREANLSSARCQPPPALPSPPCSFCFRPLLQPSNARLACCHAWRVSWR